MKQFIYVFSEQSRDELIRAGFVMLKEESNNGIFVFKNDEEKKVPLEKNDFVLTNILTF